jgi:hypothetical protein
LVGVVSRFVHGPNTADRAAFAAILAETATRCKDWPRFAAVFSVWSGQASAGEPLTANLDQEDRVSLLGVVNAALGRYPTFAPLVALRDAIDAWAGYPAPQTRTEPVPEAEPVTSELVRMR